MDTRVTLGEQVFAPATKRVAALPVTTDLDGTELKIYVHVITGRAPGPVLALITTLHGDEFLTIELMRRLVEALDPSKLTGTVLAVPVGNPVALQALSRNMPDQSDAPDLNRVFPGPRTRLADQLAGVLTETVLRQSDYLIHFDMGMWGASWSQVLYATDFEKDVAEKSRELAFAFGHPRLCSEKILSIFPGPGSVCGYAGAVLKIPNLMANIGGAGFDKALEDSWLDMNLTGASNVMRFIGMLDGQLDLPERYLVFEKAWWVNPSMGGYLLTQIPPGDHGNEVEEGQLLGRVVSPYTFEVLEELRAPGDGVLVYTARDYAVRPGYWAYGVIDLHDENTRWVEWSQPTR